MNFRDGHRCLTPLQFGGNSNWRGPIWFAVNFLLIERCVQSSPQNRVINGVRAACNDSTNTTETRFRLNVLLAVEMLVSGLDT